MKKDTPTTNAYKFLSINYDMNLGIWFILSVMLDSEVKSIISKNNADVIIEGIRQKNQIKALPFILSNDNMFMTYHV